MYPAATNIEPTKSNPSQNAPEEKSSEFAPSKQPIAEQEAVTKPKTAKLKDKPVLERIIAHNRTKEISKRMLTVNESEKVNDDKSVVQKKTNDIINAENGTPQLKHTNNEIGENEAKSLMAEKERKLSRTISTNVTPRAGVSNNDNSVNVVPDIENKVSTNM